MDLNLIYESNVASAPAGFQTALTAAADYLDRIILNPITVNIEVGWGQYDGSPLPSQTESLGGIAAVFAMRDQLWIDGREAALDSPALREGWHAPEPGWRWTTGDAAIAVAGVRHIAFRTTLTGRYWTDGAAG